VKWRIFYADESTFSSHEGKPEEAPGLGVVSIVVQHKDKKIGAYLQHQTDYYIWLGNRWLGCDLFRLWQYLFVEKFNHSKVCLAGQTISNDLYHKIHLIAKHYRETF
jgi:hypothetical protein